MDYDYGWFDEKCNRHSLTYDDKKNLFHQLFENAGIKISNREKYKLECILKEALFHLKKDKNESSHVIAHNLLICFIPLIGLTSEKHKEYIQGYRQAIKKHIPYCKLEINCQK